ncbi:MAG TPA: hypothetical protein PL078_04820 [Bacillota bacterium]|nr:hypothetical protein [Peptococcaceae bacterium MAG4]NLW37323.1 hypothetical protein [Peptococcaceae bacterium]HPZ43310.1 hypothetical protein [Bacillota bacterium]HQD75180.1 hypothetical protein [Bacillota bacterium]HUM57855.1 hypothetical protein [Bacillota bacterium]
MLIKEDMSRSGMTIMLAASVLLTIPLICYTKDIADSLREISGRNQIHIKDTTNQP